MKISTFFILLGVIILFGGVAVLSVVLLPKLLVVNSNQQPVVCTMEAKMCPDGSAVGRSGPNCEFSQCPVGPVFGNQINFTVGKKVTLSDGLSVTLEQINDSRCKENVVCIWAGELSPVFTITGGSVGSLVKQIQLGSTRTKQLMVNGYLFALNEATEISAVIIITQPPVTSSNCYVGGCSGEICSDQQGIVSTCIYKPEYACYKNATCQRQPSGQCGWTSSAVLTACLSK